MENDKLYIDLISTVIQSTFDKIIEKYEFKYSDFNIGKNNIDCNTISIEKGNLIIYTYISVREGYEFYFRYKNWAQGFDRSLMSFLKLQFKNYDSIKTFLNIIESKLNSETKYSKSWYELIVKRNFDFIETYFPTVFEKGDLEMFDNSNIRIIS
jgi:hypothetical protein